MAPKQTPSTRKAERRRGSGGGGEAPGPGREGDRGGSEDKKGGGAGEKENPQWAKQFCQREHIQLKSLLDGEELELSDQSAGREKRRAGG